MSTSPVTPCILIIDDDRDLRETLGALLSDEGFAIEASWNGRTALDRLESGYRPDAIVLDLMMPVMDGLEFRALQRRQPALASIPVLGLTANPMPSADFVCLRKPLRFETLIAAVRALIPAR
jgi:CheY-like chemotaxis protein